ncbi:ABC transporter permease [Oceanibium sediminis]|uniref:ABC transporter permease n=1 Tax=Oceanibium sediminis TaxID=2026339 RepID=UPI000DD2F242|nr:ABC transporter permease [Oceanibium sediminis]
MMFLDPDFILSALRTGTPLMLVALGVLVAERAGVLFLGVEGVMLTGAFFGVLGAVYMDDPWAGVLTGTLVGMVAGLITAALVVWLPTDQVVMGLALNIAAIGLTSFLFRLAAGDLSQMTPPLNFTVPESLADNAFFAFLFGVPPLTWLTLVLSVVTSYLLFRSAPGLLLRSVGQDVKAARSAGIDIRVVRTVAMVIVGGLTGLGGAALTVGWVRSFSDDITAGRGFIALAAVYFGRWYPGWTLFGCLLFGIGESVAFRAQMLGGNPHLYLMIPYVLTVAVLALTGRARAPREVGRPYEGN